MTQRTDCPACFGVYAVRRDGRVRRHRTDGSTEPCPGSGAAVGDLVCACGLRAVARVDLHDMRAVGAVLSLAVTAGA